jgi:hypothetical protein
MLKAWTNKTRANKSNQAIGTLSIRPADDDQCTGQKRLKDVFFLMTGYFSVNVF